MRGIKFIGIAGRVNKKGFTAVIVHRQYPLVLSVKVSWKQGIALGSEEGRVEGSGLLVRCGSRGRKFSIRAEILADWFVLPRWRRVFSARCGLNLYT